MHIGIHVNTLPTTSFIERLATGLKDRGFKVTIFGTSVRAHSKIQNVNYATFKLHSSFNLSKTIFYLKYALLLALFKPKLKRKLDQKLHELGELNLHNKTRFYPILWLKPDVLHIQWIKGIQQYLWVREFGIKLVGSLRGTHIYMNPVLDNAIASSYRLALPRLDGAHAVCQNISDEALKYGLLRKKVQVIYSGIDINQLQFIKPSQKKRREEPVMKIISVGRSNWIKGYTYALDAISRLQKNNIKVHYSIAGGGQSEEILYQVSDLELDEIVTIIPWQSFEEIKNLIQEADILLLPSISEGIANAAIEAMALGTLVIATNVGGMEELIIHKSNGYLIPSRSVDSIVEAIHWAGSLSTNAKDELAEYARNTVEERFNLDSMILNYESFYRKVVA